MGCIASKIFAYIIASINTAVLITYFTSIGLFLNNCNQCFPDPYLAVILVIGPLLFLFYGYLLAYICWRKDHIGMDKGALPTKYIILAQLLVSASFGMALLHIIVMNVTETLIGSFSMQNEPFFVTMGFIAFFYSIILMVFGYFILMPHEPLENVYSSNKSKITDIEQEKQDLVKNEETNKIEIIES